LSKKTPMKFRIIFYTCILLSFQQLRAQDTLIVVQDSARAIDKDSASILKNVEKTTVLIPQPASSPYVTSFKKDGVIILGSAAVTVLGYTLIKDKHDLSLAQLATKKKDNLLFMDRWVAGNYSEQANKDSYILFNASYVYPLLIALVNKNEHKRWGQVTTLFIETVTVTGAMYTLAAGLVYKSRPYVYGDAAPVDLRLSKGAQRSFYGGHVATTAAASFFTARVFQEFNPHSKLQPYLWIGAAALPALMAYERMRAGYHFLSDCLLSYGIGAATGLLIPDMHKNKHFRNVSILPNIEEKQGGITVNYRFR
jgi:membrane-associated phospholipid phosphatase